MAYTSESIVVIRDDIKKIRQRPESYIGYRHWEAFKHLIKETIQNSIDEAASEDIESWENRCDEILIDFDERTKTVSVIDNGRGIPLSAMYDVVTVIQSSGKFNKGGEGSAYRKAAGRILPD